MFIKINNPNLESAGAEQWISCPFLILWNAPSAINRSFSIIFVRTAAITMAKKSSLWVNNKLEYSKKQIKAWRQPSFLYIMRERGYVVDENRR
ncbi:hypothetical protein DEHRE_05235 [Dehalobacter restrictus DSM 9455]|uniref:Uncharacterized protein n=1 Tax=Dehalobacter restrictus (strain DSM 9455 / PER-K23) TaxID=871738 RepID=A0ABM5P988_DEHRP|nr:hypothetical protein DEHRE_05235 [Dehalobacter restrictus DSM 9455]